MGVNTDFGSAGKYQVYGEIFYMKLFFVSFFLAQGALSQLLQWVKEEE